MVAFEMEEDDDVDLDKTMEFDMDICVRCGTTGLTRERLDWCYEKKKKLLDTGAQLTTCKYCKLKFHNYYCISEIIQTCKSCTDKLYGDE